MIKTSEEIESLCIAGQISVCILDIIAPHVQPGVTTTVAVGAWATDESREPARRAEEAFRNVGRATQESLVKADQAAREAAHAAKRAADR